jgi:small subunit ribosomal protein S6
LRKLAYPIQKKSTGFYAFLEFAGEPTIVNKLETAYRRDEKVLRFLTFRQEKYAHEYALKRRSLKKNAPKVEEAPAETVAEDAPQAEVNEVTNE